MNWWQVLLFPFAILYDLVTRFRNHLYNIGYKKSFDFEVDVIGVGNLSVGGTGKTPMVMYLIEYFVAKGRSVATLSRGYGRKTKGFRICGKEDNATTVGDEPYTYFERFRDNIVVSVCEDRALGIPFILAERPETDLILLDDSFQHRSVHPKFNILLTTSSRPFWTDFVLPSGLLRESRSGAKRADAILITKSREKKTHSEIESLNVPHFQTQVTYGSPQPLFKETPFDEVIVVAGLADNQPFVEYVENNFSVRQSFLFNDHHSYQSKDIESFIQYLGNEVGLITTHKDAVKLRAFEELQSYACVFIPIKVDFLEGEERFLQLMHENLKD